VEVLDPVAPTRAGGWKVDVSRGERNGRVSSEWFNRPDDERYLSLDDLWASVKGRSERSRCRVVQTADIRVAAAHTAPSGCFGKVVSMIRPAALGRTRCCTCKQLCLAAGCMNVAEGLEAGLGYLV
jgi:hypothetical protein